jgi:hypothetical protein
MLVIYRNEKEISQNHGITVAEMTGYGLDVYGRIA